MFASMRNKTLNTLLSSTAVLGFVNKKLERYGMMEELFIDGSGYHAVIRLHGRETLLKLSVSAVKFSDGCTHVSLHGVSASELWLQHVLEDFLEGREFALPEAAVSALKPFRSILPQ